MRVLCIGGGPAGLYLSVLLKRADPSHEVIVYERNRPNDTFGFGVVFSDATLGKLAAADPETYAEITASFAHWDDIHTHVGGQMISSTGHGFSGLGRKRLLEILYARAEALGVELHFETEVARIEDIEGYQDADLIVGADGVGSMVRDQLAEHFEPQIVHRPNKFVWLGTTFPFEAFTFYFKENEHGLFRVHAYRYAEGSSTFIVECTAETFERTGLPIADEDAAIAYLEGVFAEELQGHKLTKNRSIWRQFPNVSNKRWHHGNVVLVGDAVHTAHFSIGSGTKLAMEDCIELADALGKTDDVPAALELYERTWRPQVESLQKAAQVSLEWFENTERYMSLEPLQFTFSLLTRSLRVTHANLQLRDPELVTAIDTWHAGRAHEQCGSPAPTQGPPPPPMFTPLRLRDLVLANRVVAAPVALDPSSRADVADWALVHVGARALGGVGLVMTRMRKPPGDAWAWKRIVDFVHEHSGSRIGVRIGLLDGGADVSVAELQAARRRLLAVVPELDRVGFDLIEIDLASGASAALLSPLTNTRGDELGGDLEARSRFAIDLVGQARKALSDAKPLSVRLRASEWNAVGFTDADAVVVAGALREQGCDIISVTSSSDAPARDRLFQTPFADRIRQEAGVPTIAEGAISSYQDINSVIAAGRADLCCLGRALMFDPHFVRRAAHAQGYPLPWPPVYHLARKFDPRG